MASNSCFRGMSAFVAEVAVPLQVRRRERRCGGSDDAQDAVGDGWTYTIWTALIVIAELLILLALHKGRAWREQGEARDLQALKKIRDIYATV